MAIQKLGCRMVLKKISFVFFACILVVASCNESNSETSEAQEVELVRDAKTIYVLHCEACHGLDGTKGLSNAANLQTSSISDDVIKNVILNGNDKGMMPYKSIITSEKEIEGLIDYVKKLRK